MRPAAAQQLNNPVLKNPSASLETPRKKEVMHQFLVSVFQLTLGPILIFSSRSL
jgi:hypothetical protein